MDFFSSYEEKAIREIYKINSKMQEIRTQLVLYGDCINSNNIEKIKELICVCSDYAKKIRTI